MTTLAYMTFILYTHLCVTRVTASIFNSSTYWPRIGHLDSNEVLAI